MMKDEPVRLHITKSKAEQSDIKVGSEPPPQAALTLNELAACITEQNRHAEVNFGVAVGNEIW